MTDAVLYLADVSALTDPECFAAGYVAVPDWRKEKIDAIRTEDGKRLSLGAGLLLHTACKDHNIQNTVEFSSTGKPYFAGPSAFRFNLSHSGQMVALLVADVSVGCDLEQIKKGNLGLAKRFFAPSEIAFLENSENPDRDFFRIWTLKESFLKATGKGLSFGLDRFCIEIGTTVTVRQNETDLPFCFWEHSLDDYRLACCFCAETAPKIQLKPLRFSSEFFR